MLKKLACLVLTVLLVFSTSVATADAATMTLWGNINKDGSIASGSGGFTIIKQGAGQYKIEGVAQLRDDLNRYRYRIIT